MLKGYLCFAYTLIVRQHNRLLQQDLCENMVVSISIISRDILWRHFRFQCIIRKKLAWFYSTHTHTHTHTSTHTHTNERILTEEVFFSPFLLITGIFSSSLTRMKKMFFLALSLTLSLFHSFTFSLFLSLILSLYFSLTPLFLSLFYSLSLSLSSCLHVFKQIIFARSMVIVWFTI